MEATEDLPMKVLLFFSKNKLLSPLTQHKVFVQYEQLSEPIVGVPEQVIWESQGLT